MRKCDGRGEMVQRKEFGDFEFLFFRDASGQIRAYVRIGLDVRRKAFNDLPAQMQKVFLELAGVQSATELKWDLNNMTRMAA